LLPKMNYEPQERSEMIRQAYKGLFQLASYGLFDKYVDFIDVYANIEETERIRLCNELKEHKETVMLAQYIRDQGREQGIEQGIRQGETYLLCHMIAKKYKVAPEQLSSNIEKLSAKSLMELSEIILERNSYDKVDTWIRQQCLREIGEKQ